MTKEQILTAITQAANDGAIRDVDTGFITKIKAINKDEYINFWIGTRAEYNALATKDDNCLYIISNDDTYEALVRAIESTEKIDTHNTSPDAHATQFNSKVDKPTRILKNQASVAITLQDNCEYDILNVSTLNITGITEGKAHGFIVFGSTPSITISGFHASSGADITGAAANTTWEFDALDGYVIWKNWSAT